MAKNVYKYDGVVRSRIIELASQGYTMHSIATMIGVHRNTLSIWVNKYGLKEVLRKAREEGINSIINNGLIALARGVEVVTTTEERVELDDNGMPTKIKVSTTKHAPKEKAIELLAKRYAPELDVSHTKQTTTHVVNIDSMSYKEILEYRSKHNVLDAEYQELDAPSQDTSDAEGQEGTDILDGSASTKNDAPRHGE